MLRSNSFRRLSGFTHTEYLVLLTCIAIAAIAVLSLFGRQIKDGIAGSANALGPNSLAGSSPTENGNGSAESESGSPGDRLPVASAGGGLDSNESGETTPPQVAARTDNTGEGKSAPANRLSGFQRSVEAVFNDPAMSEAQKTAAIIKEALRESGSDAYAAHELVQDLRRKGWSDQETARYNNPALVNAHYYFKGWMPGDAIGSVAMNVYDEGIKQYLGAGAADAVAEFWSGRNDNRPSSGYSPSTREWFERGVADKARLGSDRSP